MRQISTPPATRPTDRVLVRFSSDGVKCAAWHYPGTNGACVVMAGGMAVPKEPGTDRFARAFHQAGFSVLAFDYRGFGESDGQPRQIMRIREQLNDWDAAIAFARTLPEVDEQFVVAWGFSVSGGHVLAVGARNPGLAAAIAQTPTADGQAATRNAMRYQSVAAMLRLTGSGLADIVRGWFGAMPILVPLSGPRGSVAVLTTPDSQQGDEALDPDGAYADWPRTVAARSALQAGFYRPGRHAARINCPLLVVVANDDQSALAAPAARVARKAPNAEIVRVDGGHYAPFLAAHDDVVGAELEFLQRRLGLSSSETTVDARGPALHPDAVRRSVPAAPRRRTSHR